MKKLTDDNFKKNALFSNETFIIWITFLLLLGDLDVIIFLIRFQAL